jgi:hypothetical protein
MTAAENVRRLANRSSAKAAARGDRSRGFLAARRGFVVFTQAVLRRMKKTDAATTIGGHPRQGVIQTCAELSVI